MNIRQAVKMAWKSIVGKKGRSILTMLGVIIGIAAVMTIVATMNGYTAKTMEQYSAMGSNKINVQIYSYMYVEDANGNWVSAGKDYFPDLYDYCKSLTKYVVGVTPEARCQATVVYGTKNSDNFQYDWETQTGQRRPDIYYGSDQYSVCNNLTVMKGRDISELDVSRYNQVCVMGSQAAEAFFARFPEGEKIDMGVLVPGAIPEMLEKMSASRRFKGMRLNCFTDHLDVGRGEQFAALAVETGDGLVYLSFRGTDDTLAGWKEDFELACMPEVPAQKKAVRYVRDVARQYPRRRLRLGGHSKGGNLAVYAGVFCPAAVQRRIEAVWSNDGPGFHEDLLDLPEHRRIAERIYSIVPKSSVVGMLLEHEEDYAVVDSDQLGFLQHDGFSWQVMGDRFVTLRQVTRQARLSDLALRKWVHSMPVERRERFVDALFEVLGSTNARTLTDLSSDRMGAVTAMIRRYKDFDKETRQTLLEAVGVLLKVSAGDWVEDLEERGQELKKLLNVKK